jgi:probable HAF family extracellular repeat protein
MYAQTPIPAVGGAASRAVAIGSQGEVVGFAENAAADPRAFFFDANGIRDLGILGLPIPPAFGGLTLNISGATAIGTSPAGTAIVVGSSGFIPGPLAGPAAAAGIIVTALEQAFVIEVAGAGTTMRAIGTFLPSPLPGVFLGNSHARAVNQRGQIVGVSDTTIAGSPRQAFMFDLANGTMTNIGTLVRDPNDPNTGAFLGDSEALGINNNGQIVGVSDTGQLDANNLPIRHAFLFEIATGHMSSLGTLLAAKFGPSAARGYSEARSINDSGKIVGVSTSLDAGQQTEVRRAFVFDPNLVGVRMMRDLGTFDAANRPVFFHDLGDSEAFAINNNGDIVGWADTAMFDSAGARIRHAFRLDVSTGQLEDLHAGSIINPGNTFLDATGINDAGQICGNVSDGTISTALRLTPIP